MRRIRRQLELPLGGPLLPGEYRPLAPVPAASEPSQRPPLTEAQCLAMLIKHYRWAWLGQGKLRRFNPHGRDIRGEVEALEAHGLD